MAVCRFDTTRTRAYARTRMGYDKDKITYFNIGEDCYELIGFAEGENSQNACEKCELGRKWCEKAFGSVQTECKGGYLRKVWPENV